MLLTDMSPDTTLPFGRYRPLFLAGTVYLSATLINDTFSWLNAGLGGIALIAALVHLLVPKPCNNDAANATESKCHSHDTDFTLANVSSSLSIAASLTIVIVWLLQ